jgi:hypothetical protein
MIKSGKGSGFCGMIFAATPLLKPVHIHITYFVVLALVGLLYHPYCHAQNYNYVFSSRVVSDSSFNSIRDCHIINKTQRTGTVSNSYGDFKITDNVHDSISFSAIGYEKRTIALTDSMFTYGYVILLTPTAYVLDEVTIRSYKLNFSPIDRRSIAPRTLLPNQGGVGTSIEGPVTFFYNLFSREGRHKRYYKKITEGTADFMRIGEKFNGEMVSQITGLRDDELVKFMSFCNFSNDFLLNYSMETIKRAIRKKYGEYKEHKEKSGEQRTYLPIDNQYQ